MGRVGDELPFRELAPLLIGQVVDDEQRPVGLGLGGDADDAVRVLLVGRDVHLRRRRLLVEESLGEVAQAECRPRLGERVALAQAAAEQPPRLGVREVDDEVLVDREDALVQALEQEPQTVALRLDATEGAPQLATHPVEVLREHAELVAEVVTQRRLEVAVRDRLGGRAQATQPQRDQLGEEEADDDADHAGDHACPQCLAVDGVDCLRDVGSPADRHERLAAIGDGGHEDASVGGSLDELAAGERSTHGVAFETRRRGPGSGGPEEAEPDVQLRRDAVETGRSAAARRRLLCGIEREPLAVVSKSVLRAIRELRDDDRGRGGRDDGERRSEPPPHADERPDHGESVGIAASTSGYSRSVGGTRPPS